jgi:hypothetical protein
VSDPLSIIALGAVVGGAAGKFVEKAWDSGERWLSSYFQDHRDKARQGATVNAMQFLNALAARIAILERNGLAPEHLEAALDHPDFAATLQEAMLGSARTESREKHELFARLVADRLKSGAESTLALATRAASEAISLATARQLRVLGLLTTVLAIRPSHLLSEREFMGWLQTKLAPYYDLSFTRFDLMHLEALDCLRPASEPKYDLAQVLRSKDRNNATVQPFFTGTLGVAIASLWEQQRLWKYKPTSIGLLVGLYVADYLVGSSTEFEIWD